MNLSDIGTASSGLGQQVNTQGVCPACGYCPHCGRGGHYTQPFYPSPGYIPPYYTPTYPNWGTATYSGVDTQKRM